MKKATRHSLGAFLMAAMLTSLDTSFSQRVELTSSTTTSEGTVSVFGPQAIAIRTETGTQPVRYISSETTNYVDESGNPVAVTSVKPGVPVTVYYTKVGDTLVASKVMVRRAAVTPVQTIATTESIATSAGTISEFGQQGIIIKTESSADPLRYSYSKTTKYVDEAGAPVSIKTVRSGLPVTVYYTKIGDTLVASKVIVRKVVSIPAPIIEERKTTTTTTTTRDN